MTRAEEEDGARRGAVGEGGVCGRTAVVRVTGASRKGSGDGDESG